MNSEEMMSLIGEALNLKPYKSPNSDNPSKEVNENVISTFDNNKLCSIIASNRYLKINPKMQILCMKELAKRRVNGDSFLFEDQIDAYFKNFTPISKNLPDISDLIEKFRK